MAGQLGEEKKMCSVLGPRRPPRCEAGQAGEGHPVRPGHGAARRGRPTNLRLRSPGSSNPTPRTPGQAPAWSMGKHVPRQTTFAPSRRPARAPKFSASLEQGGTPFAAPAESPSTSGPSTGPSGRHAGSTLPRALGFARAGAPMTPLLHGQTLPATTHVWLSGIGVLREQLRSFSRRRRLPPPGR
jgi:hypothetical protein